MAVAHATLRRGAASLSRGLGPACSPCPPQLAGTLAARVIGNGLRELDRFLNVLIDECALANGGAGAPAQRNTARKYAAHQTLACGTQRLQQRDVPAPADDAVRLAALARARNCLFYSRGMVTRGDERGGGYLTVGWYAGPIEGGPLRRFPLGSGLTLRQRDLRGICRFYERLADGLVAREGSDAALVAEQPDVQTI